MATASREEFTRTLSGRRFAVLTLPVSGLTVRLQSLTERERSEFESLPFDDDNELDHDQLKAQGRELVVRVLVDDQGVRMFKDDDAHLLEDLDGADIAAIVTTAREHVGLNRVVTKKKLPPAGDSPST